MQVLNKIDVSKDKSIETINKNGKTYYVCSVCGRLSFRKTKSHGKIYCRKHYRQFKKFGKPIDDNPRTVYDKNEIRIEGDVAYIDVYNKYAEKIATGILDTEDVNKIRHHKWKLSTSGYLQNTPKHGRNIHFSRAILDTDGFVDHINHNTLDNRKCNLHVVSKAQNQMNANHKGVSKRPKGDFYAYIKKNQHMLNLGIYPTESEALYARWFAERQLFGKYAYKKEEPVLPEQRKEQIRAYVTRKVQRL